MIYVVVAIRDRVADVYQPPQCVPSAGIAVRYFTDEINRASPDNLMFRHPDDFDLFQLGTYDDATGMITQDAIPRQLVLGRDVKRKEN